MSEEAKEVIAVIAGVVVLIAGYIKLFFRSIRIKICSLRKQRRKDIIKQQH